MDPQANLIEQERIIAQWGHEPLAGTPDGVRLSELRDALNEWLLDGGFQPDWEHAPLAAPHYAHHPAYNGPRKSMTFTVDTSHVHEIERNLAPPMRQVITLPVVAQMGARGAEVIVYICTSPFGQRGVPTSDRELKAVTTEIAWRLARD